MAWLEQLSRVKHPDGRELIGASFRGVPFFVESSSFTGGRRTATHQFIDAAVPKVDDLGKLANVFSIEGYVLGSEYIAQRDALVSALQDVAGPGELVHPFYGRKRAQCGTVSVRETQADGGIAIISFQFSDAPEVSSPTVVADYSVELVAAADRLYISNSADLVENLVVVGQPAFALLSLSAELTAVSGELKDKLAGVVTVTQELALMSQALDLIADQASTLIRTPAAMLDALIDAVEQLSDSLENLPREMLAALTDTLELLPLDAAFGGTVTRIQERANQTAIADALRVALAVQASRVAAVTTFETVDDATAARDAVIAAVDSLAGTAGNTTYPDIVNLRSSLLRAIPGDASLSRVVTIERFVDVPALLLSYQLYGNTNKEGDIIARNNVRHPGFVSGTLEVLSDV